jgi:hypothetical protein
MKAVVTCVMIVGIAPVATALRAESPTTLTVRVYNSSGIPAAQLRDARTAAAEILRDAGLVVIMRHCGGPSLPEETADSCDEPLKPSEVVVRIIMAPPFNATLHPDAYGVTYVVRESDRGWLATVFSDRTGSAASRVGVDPGTLLGRVMAHEIGHLLLGTGYHGEAGVMRAEWPDALLSRREEGWRFSTLEAAQIHRVLASIVSGASAPL